MKVTFVSNYINHHQIPVLNEFYRLLGEDYTFIQTEPIEQERLQMGWADQSGKIPYLKLYYEEPEACRKLILDSDAVIFGGTDEESYIVPRLKAGKLTIRYSERLYKTGQWKAISPRGLKKKFTDHTKYRNKPVYLLCSGAYVPSDFSIIKAYPDKMLKWGYFPETITLDVENILCGKKSGSILWAGRFIDWKHPELAIQLAEKLKKKGYDFQLTMVGGGEMEATLRQMVQSKHLEKEVKFAGFLEPVKVREAMQKSQIYLLTSDYQEGWGAVCNEAMNSGCVVIASHATGATPYLIHHGKDGFIFKSGDLKDLSKQAETVLEDSSLARRMGKAAYETIIHTWNAEIAANRLYTTIRNLTMTDRVSWYPEGPCSRAEVIPERKMFSRLR